MVLTEQDIYKLYDQFVVPTRTDEYKNRYHPLPLQENNKKWKWEDKDFPRVIALLEFKRYVEKYQFSITKLLTFNGENDPELEYLEGHYKQILNLDYTTNKDLYDLHKLQIRSHKDFDFVCLHQTLEHVYNPISCLINIQRHMKDDGYLYINAPVCNVPHGEPHHFSTGYTLMGLLAMSKLSGFDILEAGQWGNREYIGRLYGITGEQWCADYRMLKNAGLNEYKYPVIAWVLLKKKADGSIIHWHNDRRVN
jgi:SAM-dependent methyltransferase